MTIEHNKLLSLWRVLFQEKGYAWAQLRDYVLRNGDKKSGDLVIYFEKFCPDFTSNRQTKIQEAGVYKALLYKDTVNQARRDARIYNHLSDLYALTEGFLCAKAMLDNLFQPPYQVLLQIYTHHSLKEHFEDYWRTLTKLQTTQSLTQRSITEAYYLAEARVEFLGLYNTNHAVKAMHKTDDALHSLLITNVLRYTFTIELVRWQMNETFANPFLESVLQYINTHRKWAKTYPMLYVYYVLYLQIKALQNNTADKRWLAAWLAQVQKHEAIFDKTELQKFYMAAENIAALIINKNTRDKTAYALLLSIYAEQRELGFFLKTDKSIDAGKFINYINVAIKSNEMAKATDFIENTKQALFVKTKNDALSPADRAAFIENHDIVRYARALVFFKQGRFEEVITNLRFRQFEDENFRLRSEIVFIKAGYEREEAAHHRKGRHTEHGTRQSVLDFGKLIATSQTTTPDLKVKYDLFVQTLLLMIDISDENRRNYTPERLKADFKHKIEAQIGLLERDWFLEKCAEL
jgi:hypothetical protein